MPINPNPNANDGNILRNQITTFIELLVDSISLRIKINTTKIPPFIKIRFQLKKRIVTKYKEKEINY